MSIEQLISSRERIEFLLRNYPSLRDDDKKLWVSYLVMFHRLQDVLSRPLPFEALCAMLLNENVAGTETIRRIRQKIQHQGQYERTASNEVVSRAFNVKSRVEHLLKNYNALRDNDMQLWLSYLVMFHGMKERINDSCNPYEEFCDIVLDKEVPTMESIRRSRQAFQEKSLYVGTKRKSRLEEAEHVSKWAKGS